MRKRIAFGLAVGFGLLAIVAPACSSDDTALSVVGPDASYEASTVDRGVGEPSDGGLCFQPIQWEEACFDPGSILTFATTPLPPKANQGKCASDDVVAQFLSACVSAVGSDAGSDSGVDGGESCDAFIQANPDCALCLGAGSIIDAGAPTPWPALFPVDAKGTVIPSVAACIAALSTGSDTCKTNYANDDLCTESACAACSVADFTSCATAETTDPSSECLCANPLDSACVTALNAVLQTDADSKCAASTQIVTNADFDAVFLTVGRTLCE